MAPNGIHIPANTSHEFKEHIKELNTLGQATDLRPEPLEAGQVFEKTFALEARAIFWTKGVKRQEDGRLTGDGALNLGLVVTDELGLDLSGNPHALNQTIRILIRMIMPFIILVVVSLLTKTDNKERLDKFFVKMKTSVLVDHELDAKELAKSYANPSRFNHRKLFPDSNWEFDKWDRVDIIGFGISVAVVAAIVGMLFMLLTIGS